MAGDWIKFQIDTPDKPEVLAIASRLNIDPDAVVGKLIRIWSWFDKHTVDGNAESVTISFLDRLTGVTGFGEQMIFVGWIEQNGSILKMVNFEFHNGKSAKSRALGKDRQQKHRKNSNDVSVTKALPEKRREEKNIFKPENIDEVIWRDFVACRKEKKAPITETVINGFIREAAKAGISLEDAIRVSVERNWQGFKAEWYKNQNPNNSNLKPWEKPIGFSK